MLVGPGTSDDAGVYRLGDNAIVATADFITPVCDDPRRFGRVAAANPISDVYAMGGTVLFALNLCCFPERDVPGDVFNELLAGGLEKLDEAGGVLLGGHSVRDPELKFGLAVVGRVDPDRILTNSAAEPGQRLVLSKPLGTGAIINGFRDGKLDARGLEPALVGMERLNKAAAVLAVGHDASACTDVTGYGLAGHALEIARASGVGLRLWVDALPVYDGFERMCELGVSTRGTRDNERSAAGALVHAGELSKRDHQLLFDPQTSGGLLVALPPSRSHALVTALRQDGHTAAVVGEVVAGPPRLEIV